MPLETQPQPDPRCQLRELEKEMARNTDAYLEAKRCGHPVVHLLRTRSELTKRLFELRSRALLTFQTHT